MKAKNRILLNKNLRRIFRKGFPRWIVLVIDLFVSYNTFMFTMVLLRLLNVIPQGELINISLLVAPQPLVLLLAAFLITSSFKGVIRYTSLRDVVRVINAHVVYIALFIVYTWLISSFTNNSFFAIAPIIVLLHALINSVVLIVLRSLYKSFYKNYILLDRQRTKRRVMIYGAGVSGVITRNVLKEDTKSDFVVYGFIDDDSRRVGTLIEGVRVYSSRAATAEFLEKNNIHEVIISIQELSTERLNEIMGQFADVERLELKIVPAASEWLDGNLSLRQINPIRIEDILGRKPIKLKAENLEQEFQGKTIMVTGAAGSIGSEIARQLAHYSLKKLVLIDQSESALFDLQQLMKKFDDNSLVDFVMGDVRNEMKMNIVFETYKPDVLFHAAAYKHVPLMEQFPYEATSTNVGGTKLIADLSLKHGVSKFVMISTDKAVNPTNVMGATKRVAELYVTHLNKQNKTKYIVTRFGNVLGSSGSVVPTFRRQIEVGDPITLTHKDITRFFMTIPEACQLVLEAGAMGKGGEIFVFDMGESVKIFDLAKKMIRLSGLRYPEDIDIKITGLRPGEKIYEELLANGENTIETHHPKIMIARVNEPPADLDSKLDDLLATAFLIDPIETMVSIVTKLKGILPEYISQNSPLYEKLDSQRDLVSQEKDYK